MRSVFSSAKAALSRRWGPVVALVTLAVLPACANKTADAQPVPHTPQIAGLASRADAGEEAYVCNFGYDSTPGATVSPIDLVDGKADPRITTGTLPDAVAATPNGRLVLVADEGQDLLSVLDASDGDIVATIPTGVEPDAIAVSPDSDVALVANVDDNTVTPVNLKTFRAEKPLHVGPQPDAVAIGGPDGSTALVADLGNGTVTPVDLRTMTTRSAIAVGDEPDAIALSPSGTIAAVADLGSNAVTFVDLATLRAGRTVNVGVAPTDVVTDDASPASSASPSSRPVAWVAGGTDLVPVSYASERLAGSPVAVDRLVEALAIARDGTTAWVADQSPDVTEVNLLSGRPAESVAVGGRPSSIVIPPPLH